MRISNFLLWQAAYAELWFTPVFWPDFDREHLYEAIRDYQKRDRRFGGIDRETPERHRSPSTFRQIQAAADTTAVTSAPTKPPERDRLLDAQRRNTVMPENPTMVALKPTVRLRTPSDPTNHSESGSGDAGLADATSGRDVVGRERVLRDDHPRCPRTFSHRSSDRRGGSTNRRRERILDRGAQAAQNPPTPPRSSCGLSGRRCRALLPPRPVRDGARPHDRLVDELARGPGRLARGELSHGLVATGAPAHDA